MRNWAPTSGPRSLTIPMESLINVSSRSLTASALPPHAASARARILCLFAVKCDQALHLINEALAGNVRGGDQAEPEIPAASLCLGKQNLRRRVSFSLHRGGMMNGLLSAVRRSTFISAFIFFFYFLFSRRATILSLKE